MDLIVNILEPKI